MAQDTAPPALGRGTRVEHEYPAFYWPARIAWRVTAAATGSFILLALLVRYGVLVHVDERSLALVQTSAPPWAHALGRLINFFGDFGHQALLVLILSAVTLGLGRFRTSAALYVLFTTTFVEVAVKRFLFFPRREVLVLLHAQADDLPDQLLAVLPSVETAVFPSGHVARATFLLGLGLYFALRRVRAPLLRALLVAGTVAIALVVGYTRLVLDEHFASDVLGGYCLGIAALSPALWLVSRDASPGPVGDTQEAERS